MGHRTYVESLLLGVRWQSPDEYLAALRGRSHGSARPLRALDEDNFAVNGVRRGQDGLGDVWLDHSYEAMRGLGPIGVPNGGGLDRTP